MEGNYKKWLNRINAKQDRLQDVTDNIGVGKTDASATEKLDVNGNVKANSYKFSLQNSITPQPNMLIPKTDGSGLLWYDNNSILRNIGENLFSADLSSSTARNHSLNASFTIDTKGNAYSLKNLPDKTTDNTFNKVLKVDSNGVVGKGEAFIYNVPNTITVTNINTPVQPNPPAYVQAIQNRLTQLHQPEAVMQKFTNWNIVKYVGITDNTTRVDNNDKITTYLEPYKVSSSIQLNEDVISIYTDRVLPFNNDWVISFNLNIGIFNDEYDVKDFANTNRLLGLYTNGSGMVRPALSISDVQGGYNEAVLKLTSTKYISSNLGTNTSNVIFANNRKAEIYGFILKAGNNILVQLQFGSSSISEIYLADNFLTDAFGFVVSVSKQNQNSNVLNSRTGIISNIRHYIFP